MTTPKRLSCYLLPPLISPPSLSMLVLMDGNERAKRALGRGYQAGAHKLAELALYLRNRPMLTHLVACALSKDNIEKRPDAFFLEMHEALVEFGSLLVNRDTSGFFIELDGRLGSLREKGGYASICADDFEALAELAPKRPSSRQRITLAVGYGEDIATKHDVSLLLRTGMPSNHAFRTSGVRVHESIACYGTQTLWPELSMQEVERALAGATPRPQFAEGYDAAFLCALAEALLNCDNRFELMVPTTASEEETRTIVRNTPSLRLEKPHARGPFEIIVAPGQSARALTLPASVELGYATVWASKGSAQEIKDTLLQAIDEHLSSPPLLGASRPHTKRIEDPREKAFVEEIECWAEQIGLIQAPSDCPGKTSYVRTAYRLFPDRTQARAVAKYMLLVAVGDVLFDTKLDDEPDAARAQRLRASTLYLCDTLTQGHTQIPPPNVAGRETLLLLARQWQHLLIQAKGIASIALQKQWLRALKDHYIASAREYDSAVTNNPLLRAFMEKPNEATEGAILSRYVPLAPGAIASKIQQLLKLSLSEPREALLSELRVWLYLLDVNTIGAGLAFRTAALFVPQRDFPISAMPAFREALALLDLRVRLANDMSGFVANLGHDRDEGKTNACALLLPANAEGHARANALMNAKAILRAVCQTLDPLLDRAIAALAEAFPAMGNSLRVGRALGVGAYEVGHYTTLSGEDFSTLLKAS